MAAQAAKRKIVVFGGSGFLGSRICESAVARGWETVSVSRAGTPNWSTITSSPQAPAWSKHVQWESANLFQPSSYLPLLSSATAVVHSTGILLEVDYKGVLQGRENPLTGLRRAFSQQLAARSPSPFDKEDGQQEHRQHTGEDLLSEQLPLEKINLSPKDSTQLTYELMNRDTAVLLARAFAKSEPPPSLAARTFLYISAAASTPALPARYLSTKRDTESAVSSYFSTLNKSSPSGSHPSKQTLSPVFIRAPFLTSPTRPFTTALGAATTAGSIFNTATAGLFQPLLGAGAVKAMKVDEVAAASVLAIEDSLASTQSSETSETGVDAAEEAIEGLGGKPERTTNEKVPFEEMGPVQDDGSDGMGEKGGIVEPVRLRELATRAWRDGML